MLVTPHQHQHQHQHHNGTMTGEEALGLAIVLGSSFSIVGVVFSFITYRWVGAEAQQLTRHRSELRGTFAQVVTNVQDRHNHNHFHLKFSPNRFNERISKAWTLAKHSLLR